MLPGAEGAASILSGNIKALTTACSSAASGVDSSLALAFPLALTPATSLVGGETDGAGMSRADGLQEERSSSTDGLCVTAGMKDVEAIGCVGSGSADAENESNEMRSCCRLF